MDILTSSILILKIIGLAWFITRFEPLQWIFDALRMNFKPNRHIIHLLFDLVNVLTTCGKCAAFWTGLIISHSIWIALLSSFIIFWYDKIFIPLEQKIKNPI